MKRSAAAAVILALALPALAAAQSRVTLTTEVLRDKIKGGWAGADDRRDLRRADRVPLQRHDDPGLHADRVARPAAPETFERIARASTTTSTSTSRS